MSQDKFDSINEMPKARRVATRIILSVWAFLGLVALISLIAIIA